MQSFTITRRIEIDAGHRIMTHGSKCRHPHGHRYVIEAVCVAERLQENGEQTDMVLDFGFLKEEMLSAIDVPCDHGFILSAEDDALLSRFAPDPAKSDGWIAEIKRIVAQDGFCQMQDCDLGAKLYIIPVQPTAECLARHWFLRLKEPVLRRSNGLARLIRLDVWETPNCRASYDEG